jgi:hypothetical protein
MAQGNGKSGGDVTQIREVAQVVDFEDVKQARMEEKRRKTERIFFKNLLSVYCVVGTTHMRTIEIIDVSEDGCSFQVPFDGRQPGFQNAEELTLRLYFSQDTYVPCIFRIQNARSAIVDTDFASETAALTKGQIMQQASTAMLAQANQMPNVILSLLK